MQSTFKLAWFPLYPLDIDCNIVFLVLQREAVVEIFYENHLVQLIDVITVSCPSEGLCQLSNKTGDSGVLKKQSIVKPEILSNICELLCFCVLHHPYKIK